jgi:hypothetical protein
VRGGAGVVVALVVVGAVVVGSVAVGSVVVGAGPVVSVLVLVEVAVLVVVALGSSVDVLAATDPEEVDGDGVPVSSANAIGVASRPAITNVAARVLLRRPMWIVFMLSPVVTTVIGRPSARARGPHCGSRAPISLAEPSSSWRPGRRATVTGAVVER